MRAFSVFAFLAPALALAKPQDARQFVLNAPAQHAQAMRPNPSMVVHIVDPATPSVSTAPAPTADAWNDADADVELSNAGAQEDAPNFGSPCTFDDPYATCGDFFDPATGLDHGLFCSPMGVCGGRGAACGATEACTDAKLLSIESARKASRREAAASRCPEGAQACPSGAGGFECVHTATDDQQCGACLGFGGRNCAAIPNAFATSCRSGACRVHACVDGYQPNEEGTDCIDDIFAP
ncbi:hypothetical protein Rhopal_000761-T1 [Rhodotorula paludigena]|uniref:Protein CPL1-like domain-containing protein n=1 Tax=Rhodotorula paludigena TaxID=86838 RepID=A0AAV5GDW3_9BASI|nr:hypothetical protein Rhopal_000761-T1 [Rhodotorula paludigena]